MCAYKGMDRLSWGLSSKTEELWMSSQTLCMEPKGQYGSFIGSWADKASNCICSKKEEGPSSFTRSHSGREEEEENEMENGTSSSSSSFSSSFLPFRSSNCRFTIDEREDETANLEEEGEEEGKREEEERAGEITFSL